MIKLKLFIKRAFNKIKSFVTTFVKNIMAFFQRLYEFFKNLAIKFFGSIAKLPEKILQFFSKIKNKIKQSKLEKKEISNNDSINDSNSSLGQSK